MIYIVLAAGYATRLYPLTENYPKPLLIVNGKTILDWLVDDVDTVGGIDRYIIISNHNYADHFRAWADHKKLSAPVYVLDDGSTSNETRLGAVKDIQYAIEQLRLDDDLLILAGDNLLDFSLKEFASYAKTHGAPCVMRYYETRIESLRKSGVVEVDDDDRILRMEEKPCQPFTQWCQPPFFYYPQAAVHFIGDGIEAGCGTDAPGSMTAWLSQQTAVYSMKMPGNRYDIGTLETYQKVCEEFMGIHQRKDFDSSKTYLVTGAVGFIGFFLCKWLLESGAAVIGFDNINDYYDVRLKHARLEILKPFECFSFVKGDLADAGAVEGLFRDFRPDIVVNLAAQAGVRYSIVNPQAYISSNVVGFYNILQAARNSKALCGKRTEHLLYASSSSVYGNQQKTPFSVSDDVSKPISLYAATKKSNELMAYTYSHLYSIPTTGLRFFTVYGPLGRPDMAYFSFVEKMVKGEPIRIFNNGDMMRDFTYIDDIVQGIANMLNCPPADDGQGGACPARVYNIGNHHPEKLLDFIRILEQCLNDEGMISKPVQKELLPMQPGDVYQTYADVDDLMRDFGFRPDTPLEIGLRRFVVWYKKFYMSKQ